MISLGYCITIKPVKEVTKVKRADRVSTLRKHFYLGEDRFIC